MNNNGQRMVELNSGFVTKDHSVFCFYLFYFKYQIKHGAIIPNSTAF
jgi:hypothetical protein